MSALSTEAGLLNLLDGIRGTLTSTSTSTSTLLLKHDDVTMKGKGKDDCTVERVQWVSEYDILSSEIEDGDVVQREREREREGRRRKEEGISVELREMWASQTEGASVL